jgi:saccharopine dehydrogenase-like NADP-dependent oxidoreductase
MGRRIAYDLSNSSRYRVRVWDSANAALDRIKEYKFYNVETWSEDLAETEALCEAMRGCEAVISAISPPRHSVAKAALHSGIHYFDLTEDVAFTRKTRKLAKDARSGQVFMPQCGLAPGFVSIVARHLTEKFDKDPKQRISVRLRVGALPRCPTGALQYNLTWSTEGLIAEYCNPCEAIHANEERDLLPLEGLERFSLDGIPYEAFNTSGGLGSLREYFREHFDSRVWDLNYKTIRYLGHRDLMSFLIRDMRLGEKQFRRNLQHILEKAIPISYQDVVIMFCWVTGFRHGQYTDLKDARRIQHSTDKENKVWSAIQISTSAGVCTVMDLVLKGQIKRTGFVGQEEVSLSDFEANEFGQVMAKGAITSWPPEFSDGSESKNG